MSPARPRHGECQNEIGHLLRTVSPEGRVITECPIETPEGEVRVPDVAWIRKGSERYNPKQTALTAAPDICVEVLSWSNTAEEIARKRALYASLGCAEFWTCSEEGAVTFHEATTGAPLPASRLCPTFPAHIDLD
jgi:Uma2 family endonuclease